MPESPKKFIYTGGEKIIPYPINKTQEEKDAFLDKKLSEIETKYNQGTATKEEVGLLKYNAELSKGYLDKLTAFQTKADDYSSRVGTLFNKDFSSLGDPTNTSKIYGSLINSPFYQSLYAVETDPQGGEKIFGAFQEFKNNFLKSGQTQIAQVNKYIKEGDYNSLYKLSENLIPKGKEFTDETKALTGNKAASYIKNVAEALSVEEKLKKYQNFLDPANPIKSALDNPLMLKELGRDLLTEQVGSDLYGEDKRFLFDVQSSASSNESFNSNPKFKQFRDKVDYEGSSLAINALNNLSEIEYNKKLAEYSRLKIDAEKTGNLEPLKQAEAELNSIKETLGNIKKFDTDNFLKTNFRDTYLEKKDQEEQSKRFREGSWIGGYLPVDPLKLYYATKAGLKTYWNDKLAQGATVLDTWDSITGKSSKISQAENALLYDMSKFDKTGYSIGLDEKGNAVESNQFYWKGSDGKTHINGYAIVESGLPIAGMMLETIALSELGLGATNLLARGASAGSKFVLGSERAALIGQALNKAPVVSQVINVAKNPEVYNRLATFGSVYATSYPRSYMEEYDNFKNSEDAKNVASLRATVEGLTESIIPNTPDLLSRGSKSLFGLGKKEYIRDLSAGLDEVILGMFPGASNKFVRNFGKSVATRKALGMAKDIFQEGVIEEEASLIGNYFVDKYAKSKNKEYISQNELTWDNILDTAIESTAGMLLTAPFMGGGKRSDNASIIASRWKIANNPDLYKSVVAAELENKKIDEKTAAQRIAKIDQYAQALKNLPIRDLSSIRDMKTLLENKDLQYKFFSDYLEKEALLEYVPTDEELPEYTKQLETIDKELYKTQKIADQYDNLSLDDKKRIIYDNFKTKLTDLLNHDDVSPAAVSAQMASSAIDLEKNRWKLFSTELEGHINDLDASMEGVKSKFQSFITNNNEGLTSEQSLYKVQLLAINKDFFTEEEVNNMLTSLEEAAVTTYAPLFSIQNEDEFIEALARNYVTSKVNEKPLVSNSKLLYGQIQDQYINDALFTRFVEGLSEEEAATKKDQLKERFWTRVEELKQSQEPGQAFPEVNRTPVTAEQKFEQQTQQALPKYRQFITRYNEAANKGLGEDLQMIQEEALDEVLKEEDLESFISGLASLQSIFPSEDLASIAKNAREGKTLGLEFFLSNYGATEKQIENLRKKLAPTQEVKEETKEEPKEEGKKPAETKGDVVQTYEYNGKTQTTRKEVSTKNGLTKVTFVGERSDKPGREFKAGYMYSPITNISVQQFFDDYGITPEDIAEGLSIDDIKAIKVIEERTSEGKTAITFTITYSEEMGGMSSESIEMAVNKQNFTSGAEIAALQGIELEEVPVGIELGPLGEFVVIEEPTTKDDLVAQEGYEQQIKAAQQVEQATPAPSQRENYVALGITDTAANDTTRLEDPTNAFIFSFIDNIDNAVNSANISSLGYHFFMQSDKDILAKVGITPEYKEDLEEFKAQFVINGIPVITQAQIEFYHKDFSKFGNFKLGVITDKDGNVFYFDKYGQQILSGFPGTPVITNIGQIAGEGRDSDINFKNSIPPQGQIVLLSQFINGRKIVRQPIRLKDPNNLFLHVQAAQEVRIGNKTYTLNPGVVYYKTGNEFVPYRATYGRNNTKETAEEVLTLIEAYNFSKLNPEQATLPEYFTTMAPNDFIRYIQNYAFLSPKNNNGLVAVAKPGENIPSLVRVFKNNDKSKEVSREEAINIIAATNSNPNRTFFEGERVFRPFTVENGKVKVGKEINFKTWFADSKKSGAKIDGVANRNLQFAKQDVITLPAKGIVSRPVETKPETLLLENLFAPEELKEAAPAEAPVSTDAKRQGTNARGTTYKGETTEKDGLKVTKYSEFFPDGKRISKGGRIMTPAEFIEEYNITDQDYLDSLEGATEIRIYEVREGKDTTGISIQATFPEGNIDMEVASASTSISTDTKADIERKKSLSQELISFVWERLAKKGITNADSVIGTRETIDGVDFDKFWSNVTKEDLQNLKKSYETQKQEQLDLYNKFKGEFDPSTGTITSNDTSFFDNKIKNVNAELDALEGKPPTTTDTKADIPIGKVGNTNYEVKADGVYFEGKKLDNPKNKSHKQLIEADIKRRRQEELTVTYPKIPTIAPLAKFPERGFSPIRKGTLKDIIGRTIIYWTKNVKGELKKHEVTVSEKAERRGQREIAGIKGSGDSTNVIFDTNNKEIGIEEIVISAIENIDKINAKYDAELDALEGKPETTEKRGRRPGRGQGGGIILERAKQLRNEITERQNQAAKQWVDTVGKKIFGEDRIVFEQFITNPRAWAVWSKAGMRLFADANFAEAYHESWHEFTQMYLTPEQRESLYKEAAKIYGKELSKKELEEAGAEDFRQFMLTGVMPESIQKYKATRTIFQKIADFVRNLFSNKKTLDRYFENLAKGKVGKRVDKPGFQTLTSAKTLSLYNEDDKLTPLTYQESKRYLDMIDELFVMMGDYVALDTIENAKQQAITNYKNSLPEGVEPKEEEINKIKSYFDKEGEQTSYLNLMYTPSNIESVYDAIYNYLDNLEADAAEVGDLVAEAEFSKIFGTTDKNLEQIFRYHKINSTLFTEEMISEIDEEDDEKVSDTNIKSDELGKKSQKELAPPVVLNLVKSLPLIDDKGVIVENALTGAPMFGDFTTNWNILKNTLAGSTTYQEMLGRIKDLVKSYPQFNYLLNRLPATITKNSDQQIRNEFFNIMSMEKVEGILAKFTNDGQFKISNTGTLDLKRVTDLWSLQFSIEKGGKYKKQAATTNTYVLDPKIFQEYSTEPKSPQDVLDFLKGVGFNYSQRAQEKFIEDFDNLRSDVHAIYLKLKSATLQPGVEIINPFQAISVGHTDITTGKKINGKSYNLNRLIEVESKNNLAFANDMIQVADKTTQYITNTPTYQTKIVAALNDPKFEYYEDIAAAYPELDFNLNYGLAGSHYLEYLFDFTSPVLVQGQEKHKRNYTEGKPRTIKVVSLNGISTDSDYLFNKKTIDLTEPEKHLGDIRTLLNPFGRTEENNRIGDKSTTRGIVLDSPNYYLYSFDSYYQNGQFNPKPEIWGIVYKYIEAEAKIADKNSVSDNFNKNKFFEGIPTLAYFSEILTPDVRLELYEFFKENTVEDFEVSPLKNIVKEQMLAWISARAMDSQQVLKPFNSPEILAANGGKSTELQIKTDELKRYHLLSMINRIEQYKLFNFHPFYYKNAKEAEKRISAPNATGNYSVIDKDNLDYTKNTLTNQAVFNNYADKENIETKERKGTDEDVTYLVFKDQALDSQTARTHKEDYGIHYNSYAERSKKADVQDASSVLTLDFFRKFYATSKGLTLEMRKELDRQNTIWTNLLELKRNPQNEVARKNMMDALNTNPYYIFSVKKLQYFGPGKTTTEVAPVFHKYSNKVLLPSEMVDNEQMFQIASKLFASNADYGVFSTGTKIAETTKEPIPLFDDKGKVISSASEASVISLRYLKEQQEVEYKKDKLTIFATQFRKLLFKDTTTEEEENLFKVYKEYVRLLTDYDKNKFLSKINDKEAAVKFLVEELSKKNVSAITKDLIRIKEDNKELEYTIDSLIERTMAESAIVSSLKKSIIRQKFYGSQFVQFPVSLIRPDKKLKFYRKENGKIASAETIISFSEKYYSLLDLPFDKDTTIGKLGEDRKPINPYTTLKRLNEKLADPAFRKKYKDSLTIAGVRIPVQGYNSMEKFEIVEFLPEESGKIILVPDEIVVKSGGDFDIDKLFMYEPVLRNGIMLNSKNSYAAELKELLAKATPKTQEEIERGAALTRMELEDFMKKMNYSVESLEEVRRYENRVKFLESKIEEEERYIFQNNLFNVIKERLSQPEIFEDLIEPNNTKDIDESSKSVPSYLTGDVNKRIKDGDRDMWTNLVNPLYQLYVFELAHAVEMVGIAAKANTFQTSAQNAELEIVDKRAIDLIPFDVNKTEEGNIKLWSIYDVDNKNKISQIISQVISGAVDIIKNDNILKTNINSNTVSVALYLNSMGVRFKDITDFLKEKTIYDYSKGISFKDILKSYGVYDEYKELGARGFSEYKTALNVVKGMDKSKFLTDNSDLGKLRRLATFIILQSQQNKNILPLSQGTDFDTQSFQNFEDVTRKEKDLNKVAKNNFFNKSGFDKMITDSPVSSFQITQDFIDIFEELFPISANKGVIDFIQSKYDSLVMDSTFSVWIDYPNFSRKFKNSLLTSILESNMSEFKTYADYLRVDPTTKNLEDMASELKAKAAEYQAYVPLLDEVIFSGNIDSKYISPGIMKNDSNLDIDVKKEQFAYNLNWEPMAGERVPEEFKKQVRDFFRIFAYTGIISTQLSKTPSSFLEIIPEQIYTPVIDKFVRETAKDLKKGKDSKFLDDFYLRFYVNNPDIFKTGNMDEIPNPSLKFYRNYNLNATPEEVSAEYTNVVPRTGTEKAGGILVTNEPGLVESGVSIEGFAPKESKFAISPGFQGYKGGFENTGKGTPEGDGKDKAMRQVADAFIGEIHNPKLKYTNNINNYPKDSSTATSFVEIAKGKTTVNFSSDGVSVNSEGTFDLPKVIMLARNKEFSGVPLKEETKQTILNYVNSSKTLNTDMTFVVGDMPGVDSQFIDYLQKIGAKFTIYHTGFNPRIQITTPSVFEEPKPETYNVDEMTKQNAISIFSVLPEDTPADQNIIDKANELPDDESSCKF